MSAADIWEVLAAQNDLADAEELGDQPVKVAGDGQGGISRPVSSSRVSIGGLGLLGDADTTRPLRNPAYRLQAMQRGEVLTKLSLDESTMRRVVAQKVVVQLSRDASSLSLKTVDGAAAFTLPIRDVSAMSYGVDSYAFSHCGSKARGDDEFGFSILFPPFSCDLVCSSTASLITWSVTWPSLIF